MTRSTRTKNIARKAGAVSGLTAAFFLGGGPALALAENPDSADPPSAVSVAAEVLESEGSETGSDDSDPPPASLVPDQSDVEDAPPTDPAPEAKAEQESDDSATPTEPQVPSDVPAATTAQEDTALPAEAQVAPAPASSVTTGEPFEPASDLPVAGSDEAAPDSATTSRDSVSTAARNGDANSAEAASLDQGAVAGAASGSAVPSYLSSLLRGTEPASGAAVAPAGAAVPEPTPYVQPLNEALAALPGAIFGGLLDLLTNVLRPIIGPGAPLDNPLGWAFLVAATRSFKQDYANSAPQLNPVQTSQDLDDNEIHGLLGASDPDGDPLEFTVGTGVFAPSNGTVTLDQVAGTWTYAPRAGFVGSDSFTITADDSSGGTHIHGLGSGHTATAVVDVTVAGNPGDTNTAPAIIVTRGDIDPATSTTVFTITTSDVDGDEVIVTAGVPTYGSLIEDAPGTYTYTADSTYLHSLSANGATEPGADSITFMATDSRGATTVETATTTLYPTNTAPAQLLVTVGDPDPETFIVTGSVTAVDAEGDALTYAVRTAPQYGTVSFGSDGTFTFTPTDAALDDVELGGSLGDFFEVAVDDGHGGTASTYVDVTVGIFAENRAPATQLVVGTPDPTTGVVTGSLGAADPDGDTLVYFVDRAGTEAGVVIDANGNFTYTPTVPARYDAAATFGADPDSFILRVSDGRGGRAEVRVTVPIVPLVDATNTAPTLTSLTLTPPDKYTGMIRGTIVVADADDDTLRYTGSTTGPLGKVTVYNNGTFTFAPSAAARRYAAESSEHAGAVFFVLVDDSRGGVLSVPVVARIMPSAPGGTVVDPSVAPTDTPGPGNPGSPTNNTIIAYSFLDFPGQLPTGGLFTTELTSAVTRDGRDSVKDQCTVADPCEPFVYYTEDWTPTGVVPTIYDFETGTEVPADLYILSIWNPAGVYSNGNVVGYQKFDGPTSILSNYPLPEGWATVATKVYKPGTFPVELFGSSATPTSGGITVTSEKDQLDYDVETLEQFQAYQEELQRRYAIFVNSVQFASFVTAGITPGGVVLKSVIIVNDAVVVNSDIETESDIPQQTAEAGANEAFQILFVTAAKAV